MSDTTHSVSKFMKLVSLSTGTDTGTQSLALQLLCTS